MSAEVLRYLQAQAAPVPAAEVMAACELSHCAAYAALVALESAVMARVVLDCSGRDVRAFWEAMA